MTGTSPLMPHAVCWAAAPHLVWTMVITNAITFLSYSVISLTLLVLARRTRRVIARDWAYFVIGFALFIVACGSTHLLEVITTWTPIFWVDAWTNILTAILSGWVAIAFLRRQGVIGFSIDDYAARLANTENEKRQVEASLLAAQRLQEWSRLSAVMAHEINGPLEVIQNSLYLLRSTQGASEDTVSLAHAAEEEAARVIELTRSTLAFFRQSNHPEIVNLAHAADSVRFLVSTLLHSQGLALHITHSGDVLVDAFPGEVRQVLLNLIRNACEATRKPGCTISIDLQGVTGGVRITVADQGAGIDPAVLPTLFEFGATTKGDHGNGMGLWTVKHILERHGGTIGVDSAPGQGTRFTLFWPTRFPAQAVPAPAPAHLVTATA